jgi:cytochrome b subunit of formate dehydrogenase
MRVPRLAAWIFAVTLGLTATSALGQTGDDPRTAKPGTDAAQATEQLDNATCLSCHGEHGEQAPHPEAEDLLLVDEAGFEIGVHGSLDCVSCHTDIKDAQSPHERDPTAQLPDCASCHVQLWEEVRETRPPEALGRLGIVVENIKAYEQSFHARPSFDDPDLPHASCNDCHQTHTFNVPPRESGERTEWHLGIAESCGSCHDWQLDMYSESVHGELTMIEGDPSAATCTDCHTSHAIISTSRDDFKMAATTACGGCHEGNYKSYGGTYHGKVHRLGYAYTAKCYDCHESHDILRVDDPLSPIHIDNRLQTCQGCHDGNGISLATAGFVSFSPHAHAHDFQRYPEMWIASRFMIALLIGVFAFFWLHSGLWYYREYKERKANKDQTHVRTDELLEDGKHVQVRRFGPVWRLAHLVFAIATMTLVLSGTTVLFPDSGWAQTVVGLLGGPQTASLIHMIAATVFLALFAGHIVYMAVHLFRVRDTFSWFGPDSLVPNLKDLEDITGMFKWFFGKGPRPIFERWTYWEKFDYWAVFWGVAIIGGSGLIMTFSSFSAQFLPGWVFNVALLVHGEEAFLAAVFLFTVHFFNNHFRPDKLPPPDIVMFTGSMPLEEFRHEHRAQYNRLVESGELEKYLVSAPSRPMRRGSKVLGLTLIAIGLTLLVLVFIGFIQHL